MDARKVIAAASFLRGAGLLAGILTVIAGILGMHVLTGTHSMHSAAAVTGTSAMTTTLGAVPSASAEAEGHLDHPAAAASHSHLASGAQDGVGPAEQCSCSVNCSTSVHGMTASCTPSAKTGSLSAPLPGTAFSGVISNPGPAGSAPGHWSYLPCGPSPGELSISRT
jgi:hypothetical protein